MRILIQDRYGQTNAVEVANFEYLSLFYCFPKELLQRGAKYLIDLPRNPAHILKDEKWTDTVADDAFLSVLLDGAACLVWPAFEVKAKLENFSGNDPLWKLARAIGLWGETLNQQLPPKYLQRLMRFPDVEVPWLTQGFAMQLFPSIAYRAIEQHDLCPIIDAVKQIMRFPDVEVPWLTQGFAMQLFPSIAYRAIEQHDLCPIIDAVKQMRCPADFDDHSSRAKKDFERKWYHSQTKHPIVSLELELETRAKAKKKRKQVIRVEDGISISDAFDSFLPSGEVRYADDRILGRMAFGQFSESLPEKDRAILDLRLKGLTQVEIAEQLGYSTHSAVTKRLATIGKQYRAFMSDH